MLQLQHVKMRAARLARVSRSAVLSVLSAGLIAAIVQPAVAATWCVSPSGTANCYPSITAVLAQASPNDTIQVGAGTYKEDIVIGIPLSIVGAGSETTFIDATNLANGIYIDGLDHPNLSGVVIQGITVENAKFEGILVTNASNVTISATHVTNNNTSLVAASASCPGLPAFETSEGEDCGEGVHFDAVDHSIIDGNTIDNNAGGILLTDETGPVHDNLISNNVVTNNASDCGITLASHSATAPNGVFNNTISGNQATYNGLGIAGAGAGVGLFAPSPGTAIYSIVVVNNQLIGNGLPGVTIHSHSPGATIQNFMIAGNFISANGADTEDAATPGPTGINVFGVSPVTGVVISGNFFDDEAVDIAVKTGAAVQAHLNNFTSTGMGIDNIGAGPVNATENWWGCAAGAGTAGCSSATGSGIVSTPGLARQIPQP